MFETIPVDIPIVKTNLKAHSVIKDTVLCEINNVDCGGYQTISKTNYSESDDFGDWHKHLNPYLGNTISDVMLFLGYKKGYVSNIWFQQYENNSTHDWHLHLANFVGVYYLEFPKGSPKPEFVYPVSRETFSIDVSEGDVIIFNSGLIHRSPPISEGLRKTIVSFNINLDEDF